MRELERRTDRESAMRLKISCDKKKDLHIKSFFVFLHKMGKSFFNFFSQSDSNIRQWRKCYLQLLSDLSNSVATVFQVFAKIFLKQVAQNLEVLVSLELRLIVIATK